MNIHELSENEIQEYKDFLLSGKGDNFIYTEAMLEELKTDPHDVQELEYHQAKSTFIDQFCKKCNQESVVLVVKTNNIHKIKTVCFNCHGFIKFGWPFKYEAKS